MNPAAQSDTQDHEWTQFVRVLEREERDLDGRLLKAGTKVLANPLQPEVIREDTPANRRDFVRLDFAWTPLARHRRWFPSIAKLNQELKIQAEQYRVARSSFLAAVEENLCSAAGRAFPVIKPLPVWQTVLAWRPKIKQVEKVADLSRELTQGISGLSGAAPDLQWPEEWLQWLEDMNGLRIYSLKGSGQQAHVVSAVLACVRFTAPGRLEFSGPDHEALKLVRNIYLQWQEQNAPRGSFAFFTLGSVLPWPDQVLADSSSRDYLLVSSYNLDTSWHTKESFGYAGKSSWDELIDLLRPQTRQERIATVKRFVDNAIENGYEGNIHMDMIAKETGFSRAKATEAVQALGQTGEYSVYQTSQGLTAIGPRDSLLGQSGESSFLQASRMLRILFWLPAAALLLWSYVALVQGSQLGLLGAAAALVLGVAGGWLSSRLQKQRQNQE